MKTPDLRHFNLFVLSYLFVTIFIFNIFLPFTLASEMYNEAPELKQRILSGELPAVDDRLPYTPMIIQPVEQTGQYGGTWHMGMKNIRDHAMFIRYSGYENLVRWNPRWSKVIANVAQAYTTNDNASEYTFFLRRNMKWSDGHHFTADDILFWYEDIVLNKELVSTYPSALLINNKLVQVKKLDDYAVRFTFDSSYGLFPQILAQPHLVDATTYPKHYLKQFLPKYNPQIDKLVRQENCADWIELFHKKFGTPLIIDDPSRWRNPDLPTLYAWKQINPYTPEATTVTSIRNPYYWKIDSAGNQLPYIDQIIHTVRESSGEIAEMAINGEIDMQRRRMDSRSRSDFESIMKERQFTFFETLSSFNNSLVISLNLTHPEPAKRAMMQNKNFRIGLSHAINREAIIENVNGINGTPAQPAPRPETPFYDDRFTKQYTQYNPSLADQFLDKAGYSRKDEEGYRLDSSGKLIHIEIEYTDFQTGWSEALRRIANDWRAAGVKTSIHKYSRDELYQRKAENLHDAVVWTGDGGMSVILEPRWYFPYSSESNFAQLWQRWYNNEKGGEEPPQIVREQMALYNRIKSTADEREQASLMKEILVKAREQFYAIGISLPTSSFGIKKLNFKNVPEVMPYSWIYPTPAPTNPSQYFIERE